MTIKILPYMRLDGIPTFRDSELIAMFNRMVSDGTIGTVFPDGSVSTHDQFIDFIKGPNKLVLVAKVDGIPAMWAWIDMAELDMARAHFCVFSDHWGKDSVAVGTEMTKKAKEIMGVSILVGFVSSKNKKAINFAKQCGFKESGELPAGWMDAGGEKSPTTILFYM